MKNAQDKKFDITETRLLMWMCGLAKLDRLRIDRMRGAMNVGQMCRKVD